MSTGTNKQRITQNNQIISDNNTDLTALKTAINNLPTSGDTTATASDILQGKTAVSRGVRIIGTLGTETKTVKSTASQQTITPTTGKLINEIIVSPLDLETKTVTPTTSAQTINPTSGKDGISQINVSAVDNTIDNNIQAGNIRSGIEILGVQGTYDPQPNLQSKQVTITQNTTTTVQPDSGYDGLQSVEVITNVPSSASYPPDWSEIGYQTTPSNIISDFAYAKNIYDNWDSSDTNMDNKYFGNTELVYFPAVPISSNTTSMYAMFSACSALQYVDTLSDTSNVTTISKLFRNCSMLKSISLFNTANVTSLEETFYNCILLTTIPALNTSKVTNAKSAFYGCKSLITAPAIDLSSVTNLNMTFQSCTNMVNVPVYSIPRATNISSMFTNCANLSNESLNNILAMCITATRLSSSNKNLKQLGLSSTQATTCQSLSNWTAFTTAGWTTGY